MTTNDDYFGEKSQQVSIYGMTAFGIDISSRYAKARELAELLAFAEHAARYGVHKLIEEAFYDSKACLCTFEFACEVDEFGVDATLIRQAAQETISQFELFGIVGHGGSSRDLDQDS